MNCPICFVLILLVKSLTLIDAGCPTKPNVTNTVVNEVDQCNDITLTCVAGFAMEQYAYCREGKWVYREPTCKRDQCMSDPVILNGTINTDITSRDIGQQYDFTCQEPFTDIGTEGVVTCNANGEWVANITCKDCYKEILGISVDIEELKSNSYENKSECKEECEMFQCSFFSFDMSSGSCDLYPAPVIDRELDVGASECFQKCADLDECLTASFVSKIRLCILLSATFDEIPSSNIGVDQDGKSEIREDSC